MRGRLLAALGALLSLASVASCNSSPSDPCADIPIDDFKELMIVDPSVTEDPRASNAADGPWSFRHLVEAIAPPGVDPGEFVRAWFVEWVTSTTFNDYPLDTAGNSRVSGMNSAILCPWMQRTAANGCNPDCSHCDLDPPRLDLAQAPFHLIAIVNRMDLRGQPDLGVSGEARMIFGLTDVAGDLAGDDQSHVQPGTIIFEYNLAGLLSTQDWAASWHALGSFASFDESFKDQLVTLTDRFTAAGSAPAKQNGTALSQVRSNEAATLWIWQQRQFQLGTDGRMHIAGLRDTPPGDLNGSQLISNYITQNASAILAGTYAMPASLQGGSSDALLYRWDFPNIDENLRHAFSSNTCNGCHTLEEPGKDTAFHVSPFHTGTDRLSQYVYNPADRSTDQLTVREAVLRAALCGN